MFVLSNLQIKTIYWLGATTTTTTSTTTSTTTTTTTTSTTSTTTTEKGNEMASEYWFDHQRSREYQRFKSNFYFTESYILTYLGQSCEDRGLEPIASEDKCKSLLSEFQNDYPDITYGRQLNRPDRPKGCYAMTKGNYFAAYFNLMIQLMNHADTRALCISSGKNIFSKYLTLCYITDSDFPALQFLIYF